MGLLVSRTQANCFSWYFMQRPVTHPSRAHLLNPPVDRHRIRSCDQEPFDLQAIRSPLHCVSTMEKLGCSQGLPIARSEQSGCHVATLWLARKRPQPSEWRDDELMTLVGGDRSVLAGWTVDGPILADRNRKRIIEIHCLEMTRTHQFRSDGLSGGPVYQLARDNNGFFVGLSGIVMRGGDASDFIHFVDARFLLKLLETAREEEPAALV
jgi:hypothetical protein